MGNGDNLTESELNEKPNGKVKPFSSSLTGLDTMPFMMGKIWSVSPSIRKGQWRSKGVWRQHPI